jgi:prepilin-type N-terminal cleavage/methylation domain-containing protein
MRGREVRFNSENGVTLIELMVVVTIIAIMGLFMAPAIGEWAAAFRLRGTAKDLEDALQLARLKAISTGMQYRVQLNINNVGSAETFVVQQNNPATGWTNDGASTTLPSGVNIVQVNPGAINTGTINLTFNTNGMNAVITTYAIDLQNQRGDKYNVSMSQTGVVTMSTGW